MNDMAMRCDLVIPVCNGLAHVRNCIESVFRWSGSSHYRLLLVDDDNDSHVRRYLESVRRERSHVALYRNQKRLGFVKSCNYGFGLCDAPYLVLIDNAVVVTPDWLERLLECAESDPRIGMVSPLTNHAGGIGVPMVPGANFLGMDRVVREQAGRSFPDLVTSAGGCLLLRRAALQQVGVFDEVYDHGYCAESDLGMRLTASGWRRVAADHVYVYRKGGEDFPDPGERYRRNLAIFDSRWKREYQRQSRAVSKKNPLGPVRALFRTPQRWEPLPMVWQTARGMLREWRRRSWVGTAKEAAWGSLRVMRNRRPLGTPEVVAAATRPNRLRVTYVLRDMVVAGGVLSVIQLVNELILLGVEARIVATFEDPVIYDWTPLYTEPIIFRSPKELVEKFPETDVAVATLWSTAPWVSEVRRTGRAGQAVYFLQDYEPWFFPEQDRRSRARVGETYPMIENRIVKSDWLRGMLERDGFAAHKILLGMDLDRFYPRDVETDRPAVMAMARPRTARRGFEPTIEALALVKRALPEVEIILFGARGLSGEDIPFEFRDEGVVTDPDRLAGLYSAADVFLDGSDFQGFGRCGLEAMACGAACVLTGVGGVGEYARDGENALLVPPKNPQAFAEAVLTLLRDSSRRTGLIESGRKTVEAYCHKREAEETLAYFQQIRPQSGPYPRGAV